jgi:superfamily II DNA or RNA helicase
MMERIGDRFGLLVIDEAHHFGSGVRDARNVRGTRSMGADGDAKSE